MRFSFAILAWWLLCGTGQGLQAQDLSGQWTGTVAGNGSDTRQKIVLTITEGDSSIAGVLHWYFPETQYIRHLIVSGRFYGRDSVLTIREDSADDPEMGFHVLYYRRTPGRRDVLEGHWTSATGPQATTAVNLSIRLEKKAPPFIPFVLPRKKKDSAQLKAALDRQTVLAASIPVQGTDTVRVQLYDNGEIDGDSVSLFLNNDLVLQHYRLTAQPKILLLPIDKSLPVNRLLLFAENLGRLPPNTALMEVIVHGKTYELFLSTDYKRNASVEFFLQE
ncbi:MAG TPA: hypothetical protein VN616_04165 [Puia sp.]|nr:hypothetical protein [Puia sp.]